MSIRTEIVERVKRARLDGEEAFRPDTRALDVDEYVLGVMRDCWAEEPAARPDFPSVRSRLKKMKSGKLVDAYFRFCKCDVHSL